MENHIKNIQKTAKYLNDGSRILLGIVTAVMSVIVIGQFLLRQINISIHWATEVSCLLFVVQTLLGSAVASHYMLHIGVEILIDVFKGMKKKIMLIISHTILIMTLILFIVVSGQYTIKNISQTGVAFDFSIAWFYMSLPLSGIIMLYHSFVHLIETIYYGQPIRVPLPEDIQGTGYEDIPDDDDLEVIK